MKTSIIILTFNKLKYTQQCIESIRKYTKPNNYEIIIVDNNSTDDTVGWLKQQTDIYTIYNTENMGFPSGCNQGIRVATGDEILLLNNDVMVTANWLENLRTALYSANDIGAVGPLGTNTYYQNFEKNFNSMNELQAYANMYNKSNSDLWEERLRLIGFCMLIRKAVIEKIGLLDERFSPGNYEDDDYSLRIRLAGYKLYLCKDTFIYHYGELSFRDNPNRYSELLTINGNKFSEKWGFNSGYSTQVREDVIYCVDFPDNAPLKVLEVGCSCGGTLLKLKNTFKNAEIYGIEINAQAARIAQLVADVIAGDIETLQLPYADNFFDYILFPDVLEHLRDPWNTVRNLKRYLKPGGQIIASLPNAMHYSVLYKLLGGTWAYEESGILDKTHLRFFTANEAVRMFSEAGYEDVGASPINMYTSEQAMSFVDTLCKITSEKMKAQYLAFQYIIRAKKNQSLEVQMVKKRIEPVTEAVVVQNQFKEKRLKLVNAILNLSENDFNDFSQTTLYQEYKDFILSGIQNYPLLEGDYQNLYQILYCVNSGVPAWQIQRNIIGGLLYVRPYQLPFVFNLPDMPAGMMEFYLEQMFESPPIFLNKEDAERYYRFFKAWVGYLYSNILNNPTVSAWLTIAKVFLMKANLIPLYFNEANLKEIYIERAKICEAVLKTENYQLDYQFSKRPKDRKLRVGILALHYSPQTETFTTLPFYKHLNPEEFEVVLFALRRSGHPLEQYCGSYAQELVILPDNLPEQVNMIRSYDLDFALIGTNVTAVTNPMFLLASHRLARVQLVNNSSCTTTGMKNVDYYISGTFTEPLQSAQNQYSERLRMVDGPAHCIDFGSEANSEATMDFSRAYLGIDENEVIFVSGANFYKVIPELEEVWARIIAAVPNSRLLLYPFNKNWSNAYPEQQFAKRLVHTFKQFGLAEERFIIVPTVPTRTDVLNRLRLADIYLDSFPFTGINSLLDPLEAGLPVVVKAGDTFRSLMGASMLKELHMEEFITYTEDKYIELAVLLGQKPEARANFRQKVIEGMKMQPRFIDSVQYGKQIGRILKEIAQEQYF